MNSPLVSICLPNLNTFPYLQERVETILAQTYSNWELIVIDSYSDDGSWEFFQRLAREDSRVAISQAPRGLYQCWNQCIEKARGEYVYIATSDDTMAPDCLEKMLTALEDHPECDLAQCSLFAIDGQGRPLANESWRDATVFARGLPEWLERRHIRWAPYDGLLHLTGCMVSLSITQLLIRRSLFSVIGGFETRWGSIGDRNWEMKAGLVANTIYVPNTWATWRLHPANASANSSQNVHSADYTRKIEEMIEDALAKCEPHLSQRVVVGLKEYWLQHSRQMRAYYSALANIPKTPRRRLFQGAQLLSGKRAARHELLHRVQGHAGWRDRAPEELRRWLESLGERPVISDMGRCPGATSSRSMRLETVPAAGSSAMQEKSL